MIIKNAKVLTGDFEFKNTDITVENSKFTSLEKTDEQGIDMSGKLIVPGVIDIHMHGAAGASLCGFTREKMDIISECMLKMGTTSYSPTWYTMSEESALEYIDIVKEYIADGEKYAKVAGLHFEGPYVTYAKKGGMNEIYIRKPDLEEFERIAQKAGDLLKIMAIAPDLDGAMEFIKEASKKCVISIAHTECDYDMALEAIRNGASHITHTFNAMNGFSHRAPNVLGAAFDTDVMCECISDGVHLHPSAVRLLYKMVGEDRLVIISDSMDAVGLADGEYPDKDGRIIYVKDRKATLANGTIAGGCYSLLECVQSAIDFGIPAEKAFKCASYNPAKVMKIEDKVGSIEVGKYADFLVLDENYKLCSVYKNGVMTV